MSADLVNSPTHYMSGPPHSVCGKVVEAIDITETMNFNLGNCMKYLWRAGKKDDLLQDLKKARWYLEREIQRIEKNN